MKFSKMFLFLFINNTAQHWNLVSQHFENSNPAGTQRSDNVASTSMQRHVSSSKMAVWAFGFTVHRFSFSANDNIAYIKLPGENASQEARA